ncbi:MAG: Stk1 family PASTA domain-containing Ser/Thr kinase [Propionibacteriaceae bacterium]
MSTVTPVNDPLVGHVFGDRYRLVEKLARGGMATVYRALDTRLDRVVAVKVMHEGLGDDLDFARKFDREARAAARLSHPNIVAVFDQGSDRGRPYIVMEYVEGRTLRQVISKEAPMAPEKALSYIEPVVKALAAAHDVGLVHCDVKPENVLISDRGVVKVADFGLAKAVTGQTVTATAGLLIGTVSYIPPELVTSGRATSRSDVYSAGVVLFELLTGRKPHTGETPIQVAYAHVHSDVPTPSSLGRHRSPIPDYLDALVSACTRRTPAERPINGHAMHLRVARARKALLQGSHDDAALAVRLGAGPEADIADPTPASPVSPVRPDAKNVLIRSRTPTEPSSWRFVPRTDSGRRARMSTPVSPVDIENSLSGLDDETEALPTSRTSPVRPLVRVSQTKVHRRRRGVVALVLLLLLGLAGGGGTYYYFAEARWTTTPILEGMTEQDARASLEAAVLGVTTTKEYSETVASGRVIRTDPASGARILRDGSVALVLSRGPERFDAPKIAGLTRTEAVNALTRASLAVGTVAEAYEDTVAAGVVISSSAEPGSKLKRGATVDFVVSKGPTPIVIANYEGKAADQATKELQAAGFTVTATQQNSKTVAAGLVMSQSPNSGTGKKGDAITLVVSKGPVMVAVPTVRGKSKADATTILANAGFQVTTKSIVSGGLAFGLAYGTDPAAGTMVAEGSTIALLVG